MEKRPAATPAVAGQWAREWVREPGDSPEHTFLEMELIARGEGFTFWPVREHVLATLRREDPFGMKA